MKHSSFSRHAKDTTFAKIPASLARRRHKASIFSKTKQNSKGQYQFLLDKYIDQATLDRAEYLAERWHIPPHQVMISMGWLSHKDYTRALANHCDLPYFDQVHPKLINLPNIPHLIKSCYQTGLFQGARASFDGVLLTSAFLYPQLIKQLCQKLAQSRGRIALVGLHAIRHAISAKAGSLLTKEAIFGIENSYPGCSARQGITLTQLLSLTLCFGFYLGVCLIAPQTSWVILSTILAVCFLPVVLLRLIACFHIYSKLKHKKPQNRAEPPAHSPNFAHLPIYTVLVPIFREHQVLPDLIQALMRLDYPRAKLDVKLIFESCDTETLACAKKLMVPDHFEFIIVPDSQPRTKPKALNYAMQFARGDYVVIYDAEDQPEPDQLLKAVQQFRQSSKKIACLQARLNFYNASENWLTKQFSIEYTSLFNGLLPTLEYLNFPIPLGGTSNHFRVSVLDRLGRWDAFNVTEDADLGIRLYRAGYRCKMLDSVTYEEATCSSVAWVKQRTRWLKGWMQTYAVHMRTPGKLLRQLGLKGFLGFHLMLGGLILSALIHPIFLAYIAISFLLFSGGIADQVMNSAVQFNDTTFGIITAFNLLCGYSSMMLLGMLCLEHKNIHGFKRYILTMPFYWLFVSVAAYRALYQWIWAPFLWEKTTHGVTRLKPSYKVK